VHMVAQQQQLLLPIHPSERRVFFTKTMMQHSCFTIWTIVLYCNLYLYKLLLASLLGRANFVTTLSFLFCANGQERNDQGFEEWLKHPLPMTLRQLRRSDHLLE